MALAVSVLHVCRDHPQASPEQATTAEAKQAEEVVEGCLGHKGRVFCSALSASAFTAAIARGDCMDGGMEEKVVVLATTASSSFQTAMTLSSSQFPLLLLLSGGDIWSDWSPRLAGL